MRIPLFNRLKKRLHVDVALLQDELADIVYAVCPKAVLHGGTAVWRCYGSNRFSEDLDFYLPASKGFDTVFAKAVESRGLKLLKFKRTTSTIFSKVSNGTVEVRLEASFRCPKETEPRPFERVDGTFMNVFTLPPEALMLEKANAYGNRRLVRDIYDVYMLCLAFPPGKGIAEKLSNLIANAKRPLDEKNLEAMVFSGAVPSFEQMIIAIQRRLKE